jgi:hypothetical protein
MDVMREPWFKVFLFRSLLKGTSDRAKPQLNLGMLYGQVSSESVMMFLIGPVFIVATWAQVRD